VIYQSRRGSQYVWASSPGATRLRPSDLRLRRHRRTNQSTGLRTIFPVKISLWGFTTEQQR